MEPPAQGLVMVVADGDGRGATLALIILLVVALTLLGHGLLVLARGEVRATASIGAAASERLAARAALEAGLSRLLAADSLPRLVPGERLERSDVRPGHVTLEGASREVVLVEASAGGTSPRVLVGAAWSLDPVARAAGTAAVVQAGGHVSAPAGSIRADGFWGGGAAGGACGDLQPALDSLNRAMGLPRREARLSGLGPDGSVLPPSAAARTLGLLGPDSLARRLPAFASGTVSPSPAAVGPECAPGVANWGSPTDSGGPCGGRWVALHVSGPLEVRGGEGQGVLLVGGDLTLGAGAVVAGLVLVAGDLILQGASTLVGAARVGGDVRVGPTSRVVGAACPVVRALRAASPLRRPVRVPEPPALLH